MEYLGCFSATLANMSPYIALKCTLNRGKHRRLNHTFDSKWSKYQQEQQ